MGGEAIPIWDLSREAPNQAKYPGWLKAVHGVDLKAEEGLYDARSRKILDATLKSEFWCTYQGQRVEIESAYRGETGYPLFAGPTDSEPVTKSWDSFLLKSFRRNVLDNPVFPDPPPTGWLLPGNWYTDVRDIVRTTLVVKYLDGVSSTVDSLAAIASALKVRFTHDFEARETGYYAAHAEVVLDVVLPTLSWEAEQVPIAFEIQVTTQLQEVIGRLTHQQYEKRRLKPAGANKNWQWDHTSEEFHPNYLGHLLHYAEGMILEVRDRGEIA